MFFVLCVTFLFVFSSLNTTETKENSTKLMENIRRQLMKDNYDYMSLESDELSTVKRSLSHVNNENPVQYNLDEYHSANDDGRDSISEVIVARAQSNEDRMVATHATLDKDLLYYMNDDRLEKATVKNTDYDLSEDMNAFTPKVKYKVLKVKNPNRRSMTFRRFIQEERDDGVAIMNLDDGPFPMFKLPKSRRQYMQDSDDFDDSGMVPGTDQPGDNPTQQSVIKQ